MLLVSGIVCFIGIVVVGELIFVFKVDEAFLSRREFIAVFVAYVYDAHGGLADRAFMFEPLLGVDSAESVAFGSGVVFVDDRPPPLDHFAFNFDRAWRGGVDGDFHR